MQSGYSAYAASKAGVRAMARVMASELSPRNIRVNVVAPGAVRTAIWGAAMLSDRLVDQPKEAAQQPAAPMSPHADPEMSASYARP